MRWCIVGNDVIRLDSCVSKTDLEALSLSPALTMFRPAKLQHAALMDIAATEKCCVSIACDDDLIVAYASFHPPTEVESWGDDQSAELIELGAVEVDPHYRGQRLAERVLRLSFASGRFDHTVVFATMYVWHYDLKRTGLSEFQYKRMLEKLYNKVGLVRMPTSDPEIRSHPGNELMVRIGQDAPQAVIDEFHRLRTKVYLPIGFNFSR